MCCVHSVYWGINPPQKPPTPTPSSFLPSPPQLCKLSKPHFLGRLSKLVNKCAVAVLKSTFSRRGGNQQYKHSADYCGPWVNGKLRFQVSRLRNSILIESFWSQNPEHKQCENIFRKFDPKVYLFKISPRGMYLSEVVVKKRIQNSVKHLRRSFLQKFLTAKRR